MSHTLEIPGFGSYGLIRPLVGFKDVLERQLGRFPFEANVFLMLKFRASNNLLSDFILGELQQHGLSGVRADSPDWNLTQNVYNPLAALYCCRFGLALFDQAEPDQTYSPNVAYELGMMHLQDKNSLILRHSSLPPVPFDLVKDLYYTYTSEIEVRSLIGDWIKSIKNAVVSSAFDVLPERQVERADSKSPDLAATDPAMYVLRALGLLGETFFHANYIAAAASEPIIKVRYYLNALDELGLVDSGVVGSETERSYRISKRGIETLIEHRII